MSRNDVSIWVRVKDGFSRGIKSAGAKLQKLAMDSRTYAAAVGAITAAMISVAREYSRFNKEMARSEALMGGQKHDQFRKQILALSDELGIAAVELTQGLYAALSAGVPRDNVIEFLKKAGRAAIVDGSSIETAVDGMTTVINAFGLSAKDAGRVADLMFVAVRDGKTTFQELSSSLAKVAPLAAATGVDFTEIFAAVSALTSQGDPTAEAITKIRAALLATNKTLGDGWADTMTLQQAFAMMAEKAKGSQKELFRLTGSSEALMGILGLTGKNAEKAGASLAAMSGDLGLIDAAMAGTSGDAKIWDSLFNSLNNTMILFGDDITNRVTPAVNQLTEAIRDFNRAQSEAPDKTREMLTELAKIPLLGFAQLPSALAAAGKVINDTIRGDKGGEADPAKALADAGAIAAKGVAEDVGADFEAVQSGFEKLLDETIQAYDDGVEAARKASEEKRDLWIAEVNARKEAEDDIERAAREGAERRAQIMRDELVEILDGIAELKTKQADALLFKNLEPTFSERFEQFKQDRDARKKAEMDDEAILKRLGKIAEKENRGIKVSRQDREFRKEAEDFALRELEAAGKRNEALMIQREIKLLLEQNLAASGGPA